MHASSHVWSKAAAGRMLGNKGDAPGHGKHSQAIKVRNVSPIRRKRTRQAVVFQKSDWEAAQATKVRVVILGSEWIGFRVVSHS